MALNSPGPLRPVDLQILVVLAETELHGYGLMKAVEEQSGGKVRLEVGSLYRIIDRLLDTELIAEAETTGAVDPRRRRAYRLTGAGRMAVREELARLSEVMDLARDRGLAARR